MNKIFAFLLIIFITQSVCAIGYITNDIVEGCNVATLHSSNNTTKMFPVFTINKYTCHSGQFLPADTLGCQSCPLDYICNGGTFDFNEHESQGLKRKQYITQSTQYTCSTNFLNAENNNTTNMIPVFIPNQYTCTLGYYLPANVDECTKCPVDNYCPGGTYTFNETTSQGIEPCPDAHPFAPAGMWLESQCGRKLHVGEDILYMHQMPANPTVHRLFIGHPNGIYSANAVQRDMNSNTFPKMSEGMSKGFRVTIDNVEYLICDDSVPECRND